jgi:raffinose/stachyose/melibiose transport system permease protein
MAKFPQKKSGGSLTGWLFMLPALAINVSIILIPAILTAGFAFTKWNGLGTPEFVGLQNFITLFKSQVYRTAIINNVRWTLIFLTVPIIMGLIGAAMLQTIRAGRNFFQTIFFVPMIVATVISARVWQQMIFHPMSGLLGWLRKFGISFLGGNPLTNPDTSLYYVAFVDNWHWWGFLAVVFLASMRQIDPELYEAASIEGASFWQKFWHISIPLIRPTLILMLLMTVIWSFLVFDFLYIMTEGGPGYSSEVLATLTYKKVFYTFEVGMGAAIALTMSLLAGIAIAGYIWLQSKGVEI